ncbi:hypothetical protein BWI15_31780 [Kribbella sp. ALI-6-A]|uniref:hypothetical protein n=1 Tax=Kribbella sp. ALI-6-A TaxID=1933817 RepID=UPI00097BBD0F|nr:hypothetical protein [Kribbella sp. ALI-6-A]ONI67680.1 hypothetical protein BWI15_31780 [Kribbella sp. ALI-6-A]
MTDQETQPAHTRATIAAAIVLSAVLICGALLLFTNRSTPADAIPAGHISDPSAPAVSPSTTSPAASPGASTTDSENDSSCGLPTGDQSIPTSAPTADGWEVNNRVVVPRSTTHGPAKTDPDGFRRCFAHSPTGALFAAYNAIAAIGDQHKVLATVPKLMLPGPSTDALLKELNDESPTDSEAVQLAGYRILDATTDRVTVVLAVPVESEYMSLNLTLVWHHGDWRVVPPPPGEPVGAPFSQHRDLDDFVTWKGL